MHVNRPVFGELAAEGTEPEEKKKKGEKRIKGQRSSKVQVMLAYLDTQSPAGIPLGRPARSATAQSWRVSLVGCRLAIRRPKAVKDGDEQYLVISPCHLLSGRPPRRRSGQTPPRHRSKGSVVTTGEPKDGSSQGRAGALIGEGGREDGRTRERCLGGICGLTE